MKKPVLLGLAVCFAVLSPALAGTIYVPLASEQKVGTVEYRTEVSVANPGGVDRRFTARFVPTGTDGTRSGLDVDHQTVAAGATVVLTHVAPRGGHGMLEIGGAPQLVVTARVLALGAGGRVLSSSPLTVVDADDPFARRNTAHLQGLSHGTPGAFSYFGLLNLTSSPLRCSVDAFRSNGGRIGRTAQIDLPPLSHNALVNPLQPLGSALFTEARAEVTCNGAFYPYALLLTSDGSETAFVPPSAGLAAGINVGRGENPPAPPPSNPPPAPPPANPPAPPPSEPGPAGGQILSAPGNFLQVRQNNPFRAFDLPLRPGTRYKRLTVEYDLQLGRWQSEWFHGIMSLRRTDRTLYAGVLVKGKDSKTILDLGHEQQVKAVGPWRPNGIYHVRLDLDVAARRVTLRLFQNGKVVHALGGRMTSNDLRAFGSHKVKVDFSLPQAAHSAYYPTFGSTYSNLKVTAEPF
jgi:hypothetical protein